MRNRVIAGLLVHVTQTVPPEQARRLESLDHSLRGLFLPGEFVWEAALAAVYPQRDFWFLYGGVRLPPG